MNQLPSSWIVSKIGDVANYIQRGKSPKYASMSTLPVINQKCIRWNELQTQHLKYIHPEQIPSWDLDRYVRTGDLLWNSTGTGTVGRAYLVKNADCAQAKVVDSHVTIVRASEYLDPRIIFRWVMSPAVQERISQLCDGSTNQVELSRATITAIDIPIPPLAEQRRIADKLDTVLTRVDALNDRLARITPLLKRFRQSVLATATSGRLTENWRGAENFQSWHKAKVAAFANIVDPHPSHRTPPEVVNGVPYISIGDVDAEGKVSFSNARLVADSVLHEHRQRYSVTQGDFIFGKIGTLGRPVRLPVGLNYTISANVLLVQPINTVVNPEFVFHVFCSPDFMKSIFERTVATSQAAFGIKKMRDTDWVLPPIDEQTEIVRRVEILFAYADRLEARLQTARTAAERLTPVLLAKAFRGELVPQDPNDEPATELLSRLREARAAEAPAKKTRGRKAVV